MARPLQKASLFTCALAAAGCLFPSFDGFRGNALAVAAEGGAVEPPDAPVSDAGDGASSREASADRSVPETCNGLDDDENGIVDDGPCDPPVVHTKDGTAYFAVTEPAAWTTALGACRIKGYHLVTITSSDENGLVSAVTRGDGGGAMTSWIGLKRTGGGDAKSFAWADGTANDFRNWRSGFGPVDPAPDNFGGSENCASILTTGFWEDESCDSLHPFVCEANP